MNYPTSIIPVLPEIIAIADPADTAILITDLQILLRQLNLLKEVFPAGTRHAVAIKTNPHKAMLSTILAHGFDLEAASIEEVDLAISAGAAPDRIVFDSPVKTRAEIERCAASHDMQINANMLCELNRYPVKSRCQLGLRINPSVDTGAPELYAVSTDESKFGVPMAQRAEILSACLEYPIKALHMHSGSQMSDLSAQLQAIQELFELADAIDSHRANHGNPQRIEMINIGGGLPAESDAEQPRMREYARGVCSVLARNKTRKLRTEFGQWTHRDAGSALTRVEYVGDEAVPNVFVHLGADLFTRHIYAPSRPLALRVIDQLGKEKSGKTQTCNIAGPLCFAGDYLARAIELPTISEGDWLLISGVGANTYGLWSRHCSRSLPKVVALEANGDISLWSDRKPINY